MILFLESDLSVAFRIVGADADSTAAAPATAVRFRKARRRMVWFPFGEWLGRSSIVRAANGHRMLYQFGDRLGALRQEKLRPAGLIQKLQVGVDSEHVENSGHQVLRINRRRLGYLRLGRGLA